MDDHGEDKLYCDFHPMEPVVGVCAKCLKEKLLVLATEQGHRPLTKKTSASFGVLQGKHIIKLPKVFVLYRHGARYRGDKDESDDEDSISSDQDSFISVKFDDNGLAFWDKTDAMNTTTTTTTTTTTIGASTDTKNRNEGNENKNAVEKTTKNNTLKWKKRIGRLLQLGRSKKSTNKSNLHREFGSKLARKDDWAIRSLVRRST